MASMFLMQNAMQAGRLASAQPGITLLDPLVAIAWGVFAFHERIGRGRSFVLGCIAGAVTALGAIPLSQSPGLQHPQTGERRVT